MKIKSKLGHIINEGFSDIFYIWREELKNVFKDSGVIILFFVVPLLYPVLYGLIYNNEVVRDAKMVVVDNSDSFLSREFTRRLDASPDVQIVKVCTDIAEAKRLVDSKKAYAILLFPQEFNKDLHTGKQTTISLFSDMSSLLFYKAFMLTVTDISIDLGREINLRNNPGMTSKMDAITINPVPYESENLFNSQLGFASFLLPAILIMIIQQTLVLGIGMLGGTAREKNRFHTLIPINKHFHGTLRIVLGKSITYLILYIIVCVWALAFVPMIFSLPRVGSYSSILLFVLPFLAASIFFAMTLSGFMRTRESPMMIFIFTSVMLLFISGVSWPKEAIPPFWRAIGFLFPSTAGIQGFVRISTSGATLAEVAFEYKTLWVQAGFYFITACLVYRHQIIRSRKLILRKHAEMKVSRRL